MRWSQEHKGQAKDDTHKAAAQKQRQRRDIAQFRTLENDGIEAVADSTCQRKPDSLQRKIPAIARKQRKRGSHQSACNSNKLQRSRPATKQHGRSKHHNKRVCVVYRAHESRARLGTICQAEKKDAERVQHRSAKQPRKASSAHAQTYISRFAYQCNGKGGDTQAPEDNLEPSRTGGIERAREHGDHAEQNGRNGSLTITESASRSARHMHTRTHEPNSFHVHAHDTRHRLSRRHGRAHPISQEYLDIWSPPTPCMPWQTLYADPCWPSLKGTAAHALEYCPARSAIKLEWPLTLTQGHGLLCAHIVSGKIRMRGT